MAQLMLVNPRKRRSTRKRSTVAKRRSPSRRLATTTTRTVRRYRRNPIRRGSTGKMMDTFMSGAVGAGGALAVDFALKKLPLPAAMTANPLMSAATSGFIGIGLGMLVSKFGKNKRLGEQLAGGATTVALYNAFSKQFGLAGYGGGLLGYGGGLLGYSDFGDTGMGWIDAEPVSPWPSDDGMGGYDEF